MSSVLLYELSLLPVFISPTILAHMNVSLLRPSAPTNITIY